MTEHALAREAGVRGDLRQGEVAALQKLLRPLDAAQDHVLVRRQPGGPLELPREVVDAEAGDRSHLVQARAGVEVFLDVLRDGAEAPPPQHALPPRRAPRGSTASRPRWGGRGAKGHRSKWAARTPATPPAASRPPAPPVVSSASTANMAARRCGRSRPSSGGTVSRAGSRPNASAATRATNPGSRKMCSASLYPLERAQAGLPAGTSMIAPAGGGTCRFTP